MVADEGDASVPRENVTRSVGGSAPGLAKELRWVVVVVVSALCGRAVGGRDNRAGTEVGGVAVIERAAVLPLLPAAAPELPCGGDASGLVLPMLLLLLPPEAVPPPPPPPPPLPPGRGEEDPGRGWTGDVRPEAEPVARCSFVSRGGGSAVRALILGRIRSLVSCTP